MTRGGVAQSQPTQHQGNQNWQRKQQSRHLPKPPRNTCQRDMHPAQPTKHTKSVRANVVAKDRWAHRWLWLGQGGLAFALDCGFWLAHTAGLLCHRQVRHAQTHGQLYQGMLSTLHMSLGFRLVAPRLNLGRRARPLGPRWHCQRPRPYLSRLIQGSHLQGWCGESTGMDVWRESRKSLPKRVAPWRANL